MQIQDYKFTPKTSKDSIERGIKFLEETQKALKASLHINNNGMYCKHSVNPAFDEPTLGGMCHRNIYYKTQEGCDLVSTLTHRLDLYPAMKTFWKGGGGYNANPEITEEFTRWFTQESFYSRFFIPMPLEFNTNFGLLISSDIPAALLQNMCIISRHTREKESALNIWMDLVKEGIPKDFAFVLATNSKDYGKSTGIGPGGNTHFTLPLCLTLRDAALRAVSGDLMGLSQGASLYRNNSSYNGGSQYFVSRTLSITLESWKEHWLTELDNLRKKAHVSTPILSSIPNPFKKPIPTDGNGIVSHDVFFKEIVPMFVENVSNIIEKERNTRSVETSLIASDSIAA